MGMMTSRTTARLLLILASSLIIAGLGMVFVPAGLVVAGIIVGTLGLSLAGRTS